MGIPSTRRLLLQKLWPLAMQTQDALEAVEAELPAYPIEPLRSKRLKEADKGPERVVKVGRHRALTIWLSACIAGLFCFSSLGQARCMPNLIHASAGSH